MFANPPDSLPYFSAQVYTEEAVKDLSVDKDSDEENSASSDWSADEEQTDIDLTSLRQSARFATQPRV